MMRVVGSMSGWPSGPTIGASSGGIKRAAEKVILAKKDAFFAKKFTDDELRHYRYMVNKHREAIEALHDRGPSKIDVSLRKLQFEEELRTRAQG